MSGRLLARFAAPLVISTILVPYTAYINSLHGIKWSTDVSYVYKGLHTQVAAPPVISTVLVPYMIYKDYISFLV